MKPHRPRCETPAIAEIESILTEDRHRTITIDEHAHFRRSLSTDSQGRDEIDREIDDMNVVDPYEIHAPSRKSDIELNRVLNILDNIENGKASTR